MLEYIIFGVAVGTFILYIYVIIELACLRSQMRERWRYDNKQMMRILAAQYYAQGNKTAARRMVDRLREYEAKYPNYDRENNVDEKP